MNEQINANSSPDARRNAITELLNRDGEQSVESLAERFDVSGMTIRRDLADLAQIGRVLRTHGGAAPAARVSFEFKFLERNRRMATEKGQIATLAASLVTPCKTVMLDSGTTTLAIARQLRTLGPLTVLTTSLPIASELFGCEQISTILLGGRLRQDSPDLTGPLTERMVDVLRADIAFLGADAVDGEGNAYNASLEVGGLIQKMAAVCSQVFCVADSSKIGRRELMRFSQLNEWAGLITDSGLDSALAGKLTRRGVKLIQPGSTQTTVVAGRRKAVWR
ncbi:MAG: DeoR/GlpR transcriptional regulator [Phycisphaeraceae bacterium]|nr:DeoR/GlpR transcriptional regulator [Phycisphaeraceae bacterium]